MLLQLAFETLNCSSSFHLFYMESHNQLFDSILQLESSISLFNTSIMNLWVLFRLSSFPLWSSSDLILNYALFELWSLQHLQIILLRKLCATWFSIWILRAITSFIQSNNSFIIFLTIFISLERLIQKKSHSKMIVFILIHIIESLF